MRDCAPRLGKAQSERETHVNRREAERKASMDPSRVARFGSRDGRVPAIALCILVLIAAPQPHAYSAGEPRSEKLEQLLKYLRYEDSIARLKKACVDARKTIHPDVLVKTEPDAFFGLGPASEDWPLVVKSFEQYVKEACEEPSAGVLLEKYREAWDRRLSDAELEEIISFFGTSAGAALSNGMAHAYREFLDFYEPLASRSSVTAWANYGRHLATIARGRQRTPDPSGK